MTKTVLFPAIQFCISAQFSSIWPIDRILSGATIPQSSSITRTLLSDQCHLQDTRWVGSWPSVEKQSVYSAAYWAHWAKTQLELWKLIYNVQPFYRSLCAIKTILLVVSLFGFCVFSFSCLISQRLSPSFLSEQSQLIWREKKKWHLFYYCTVKEFLFSE